jgi:hypothetical protein
MLVIDRLLLLYFRRLFQVLFMGDWVLQVSTSLVLSQILDFEASLLFAKAVLSADEQQNQIRILV